MAEKVVKSLEEYPFRDSIAIFQPFEDGTYMNFRSQVNWVMEHLEVNPKKDTDVIEIKFQAGTPFEAKEITNVIMENYSNLNREFNRGEFVELRKFLEKQLQQKGEELRESEEALKEYREQEKLISLDEETKESITRLAASQAQLEQSLVELDAYLEQKISLESQLEERKENLSADISIVASPL